MIGLTSPAAEPVSSEDELLVARVASGDSGALEALYDRYGRVVYSMVLRSLGSAELAEDVVQETFWRVWRRSATYQPGRGQVSSWIFGIAHNQAIDELRRQRSRPTPVYDKEDQPVLREMEDERSDVAGTAIEKERQAIVRAALERIPLEQREVIELAYFRSLSQSEIAEQLKSPIGTIKTRVRLGLQKLRDILRTQGLEPEDVRD